MSPGNAALPDDLWPPIEEIVALLARHGLDALESTGRTGRCRKDDLQRRIVEYGRRLVPLPPGARALAEAFDRPLQDAPDEANRRGWAGIAARCAR